MLIFPPDLYSAQGYSRQSFKLGVGPFLNATKTFNFLTGVLDPDITLTRASNAWYFNSSGVLTLASSNAPRFDYNPATGSINGMYLEQQSTNLFLNSQSPVTQSVAVSASNYTLSFYGTGSIAYTGAATGTLTGSGPNILSQKTFATTATALLLTVTGSVSNVQLEQNVFATSRIVTAASSVTRAAESFMDITVPWFNPAQGSFVLELIPGEITTTNFPWPFSFSSGAVSNIIGIYHSSNFYSVKIISAGASQTDDTVASNLVVNNIYKLGLSFNGSSNPGGFYTSNGNNASSIGAITMPSGISSFQMPAISTSASTTWLRKLTYFNSMLNSNQLKEATI